MCPKVLIELYINLIWSYKKDDSMLVQNRTHTDYSARNNLNVSNSHNLCWMGHKIRNISGGKYFMCICNILEYKIVDYINCKKVRSLYSNRKRQCLMKRQESILRRLACSPGLRLHESEYWTWCLEEKAEIWKNQRLISAEP